MNSRYYGYDLAVISSKGIQRSPCRCCYELHDLFLMPLQFANHRLIAHDGHNIMADQMKDALKHISVSISVRLGLVKSAYTIYDETWHCGLYNPG
jgi:hypothetical protein